MPFNIPVIFGMKLKRFREVVGLSIDEMALKCDLSAYQLLEIERGKRYPKPDKILKMAEVLERSYDELVSPKLSEEFAPLESFLSSPLLKEFPFQLFGISLSELIEVVTRSPVEASCLLKTLIEIASNHQLGAEHLFRASLRAYQESRNNYFEDLEEAVDEFNRNYGHTDNSYSYEQLVSIVKQLYHCHIDEHSLDKEAELQNYRSVLLPKTRPVLLLNSKLTTAQKRFILAREIGYHFLGLQVRALTSSPEKVESFEQVFNDFKASYFAGALLLNRQRLIDELRNFFLLPHWDYKAVLEMIDRHNVTPEMLFYRWSELIPRFFNLKLHFLRYNEEHGQIRLIKQLNISQISVSGGLAMDEHHCRRWLVVRLLRQLEKQAKRALLGRSKRQVFVGTQISNFIEGGGRFFCIGISNPFTFNTGVKSSVAIGLKFDQKLEKAVHFLQDRSIPRLEVGTSCERCPLTAEDCIERAAEPRILVQIQKQRERERALHRLMVHNPID